MDKKPIEVFISHHTKSSLKITEAICHSLEAVGIRVWYAPRDTEDSYAKNIVEIIHQCKVFILVLNHESSESYDVLNEINCVAERMRKKEPVHVIPFQISAEDISADAKYYLGRLHWLDAVTPPLEKRIQELTDRVSFIINEHDNSTHNIIMERDQIISSDILNNIHFVGRNKELFEIEEALKTSHKVFLKGIGGIGKSEIAKKYANLHKKDYDTIIFAKYTNNLKQLIISENNFNIPGFYRIQNETGVIESDAEFFERKLNKINEILFNQKALIIIDNFDTNNDEDLEKILSGNYDIIFTTRNDFEFLGLSIIEINEMGNIEDVFSLFAKNYPITKYLEEQKQDIINIIELVKRHTLAVELIAKYMQKSRKKPVEMYNILKEKGLTPELQGNINHLFQNNTIYNYIKVLFDLSKINDDEILVLMNLTIFGITGIDFDTFIEVAELEDAFIIDELIKKNWILHNWENDIISLHPLIIDVVKNETNFDLSKCQTLFKHIANIDSWKLSQKERVKFEDFILNIYNNFINISSEYINEYIGISKFLRDLGYYEQAENLLLKILDKQIEIYTENSENVAKTYDLLRFVNNKSYNVEKANSYNEKAIQILKETKLNEYLLADYMKSRAFSYLKDRNPIQAKPLLEEVCEIYNRILDEKHYKIGNTNIALSRLNYQLGNYEKALECAQKSYDLLSLKYDKESTDVATAIMALGAADCKLGNFEKGISELKEAVRIRELKLHPEDFSIMDALEYLADGYIDAKDFDEALKTLQIVKNAFEGKMSKQDKWYKRIEEKINSIK